MVERQPMALAMSKRKPMSLGILGVKDHGVHPDPAQGCIREHGDRLTCFLPNRPQRKAYTALPGRPSR
jgi:hypothetical protein